MTVEDVFVPLGYVGLLSNENSMPSLMVLCRAPADDGWLAIEGGTAVIYNLFDEITHLYGKVKPNHPDFRSAPGRSQILARAKWFHSPAGATTVRGPKRRYRKRVAA